ncbi:high mobility group B protein 6 [Venturia canescens]|uniref:high mobility group B protein 6 n=1 Tax=Venturia canescens TaxID=32260 RepID=UPI001C9C900C|nr:high mobility group B protein 6 [Venturia canescens]XP_043289256.1 high mobility group B protein 6 [Venturia canescens]XP_043289257.1 high mobility group B protein 6 [Venturia canescens]XP_043289258.1 high mobility group B protein 6 [Venturia canescens]
MTENNMYIPPMVKSEISDESEYDAEPEEFNIYKKKYQLLLDRCEVLQQDNERLVYRIQRVRKLLKRTRKEKKFLIDRLDSHGDRWREAPMGVLEENSVFQTALKPEKPTKSSIQAVKEEKPKKGAKRKSGKADPNAPKRPANPFFQFCQEQRPRVMERLAGEPEPSKQELTRQLATTWKSLTSEDKKVYYDMYERSKEKYVAEMQIYNKKVEDVPSQPTLNIT